MELSAIVKDIRKNWAISDAKRDEGLTTPDDIRRFDNISYGPNGIENLLDIYVQKSVEKKQATIVNIHGGGWVYGNKEIYQFYCMSLAQRGFTVVNINYRLAPENRFPIAVEDINMAMTFIEKHGEEYFADKDKLILVGDSAGGQLVSHYSTIVTNPEFAKLFDFVIPNINIRAVGLNCGAYDGRAIALGKVKDDYFKEYIDTVDKEPSDELLERVDTIKYMTEKFPPAFVMSAQNDFLLPAAEPMFQHLQSLGVPSVINIYGTKEQEEIAHVFHVNIKLDEAKKCNDNECDFFRRFV